MKQIYLIGNAHIDPVWLWKKSEGLSEILATYRSALDRMKEFPDYIFTSACAYYYQWVEAIDPAMFAEIRQRVEEGRWSVTGGMWVQPDCNLPSGEAFCRHTLYSQGFFQEHLGLTAQVGYNVDSFGHNGMLPQLLKQAGMESYVFMRPGDHENPAIPDLFWWEAPDGSRVLTHKIRYEYTNSEKTVDGAEPLGEKVRKLDALAEEHGHPYLCFYGVGNHGGGPTIRGLRVLENIVQAREDVAFASTQEFFEDVRSSPLAQELPVVRGSLLHHASGCYAACAAVKAANRRAENALVKAERLGAMAQALTGCEGFRERIRAAWEKVLFNQFHDVLAGCSIQEAYENALDDLRGACGDAWSIAQEAMHRISWSVCTTRGLSQAPCQKSAVVLWEKAGEGAPVVVFNPHSFPFCGPLQLNTTVSGVCDWEGRPVASQLVRGPQTNGAADRWNTLFCAQVPPMGYALYYVFREESFPRPQGQEEARVQGYTLENPYLRLVFDPRTGAVTSFYDKERGRELAAGPMAVGLLMDDTAPDTWAHNINVFDQVVGELGQASVTVVEEGPLRAWVRVETRYQATTLRQDFLLWAGAREVEVRCRLDFHEQLKLLKLTFPVRAKGARALYSLAYGFEERPLSREEQPCHSWLLAAGADGDGLSLCSDSKYSFSTLERPQGAELRMTVARGCFYADHYGVRDELMEYQDQGEQYFRYSLSPVTDPALVARQADLLNMPPELLLETHHQGPLELACQGIELSRPGVTLAAVKEAEDGEGFVLRLVEAAGEGGSCHVTLPLHDWEGDLTFRPQEIKTLRVVPGAPLWWETLITEQED